MSSGLAGLLAERRNDAAVYVEEETRSISYRELFGMARRNARVVEAMLGRRQGIVALCMSNSAEYVVAYWSAVLGGAQVLPVNPALGFRAIADLVLACRARWIVSTPGGVTELGNRPEIATLGLAWVDSQLAWRQARATGAPLDAAADECVMLLPTSGTTGRPKVVMMSAANIVGNARAHLESMGVRRPTRSLVVLPLQHSYGITTQLLGQVACGGTLAIAPHRGLFNALRAVDEVARSRADTLYLTPTALRLLADANARRGGALKDVRTVAVGTAPLAPRSLEQARRVFPRATVYATYGLTECSPRVTTRCLGDSGSGESILGGGSPLTGVEVKAVSPEGTVAAAGVAGELRVRGPNVTLGYFRNQVATERVYRNGWVCTGDLGTVDAEGRVSVIGRLTRVISSGGLKFSPEEVEALLADHPRIDAAAVRAEWDDVVGEVAVADLVVRGGGSISLSEVHTFLAEGLPPHMWPVRISIVQQIARTSTGKTRSPAGVESRYL